MKQSLSLFFILLCIQTVTTITGAVDTIRSTQGSSHTYPSKHPLQKAEYDDWLDFDDEDEEQKTMQPKTRWQRFMAGVDKFALQMKALWAFKIKPWWKEKHGKQITIATASTLATLVAAWMMYRRYKKTMFAIIEGYPSATRNPFAPVAKHVTLDATNPAINRTQGQSPN